MLTVTYADAKPYVRRDHKRITLTVRPGSDAEKRAEVIHEWHKSLLHEVVPALIRKWEARLGVQVMRYFLQRMKTRWGGCNPLARHIRLNTELVKKPKDLLEYIVVHEMAHLLEPTHSEHFTALLDQHYPIWREARAELNELPLSAESWKKGLSPHYIKRLYKKWNQKPSPLNYQQATAKEALAWKAGNLSSLLGQMVLEKRALRGQSPINFPVDNLQDESVQDAL